MFIMEYIWSSFIEKVWKIAKRMVIAFFDDDCEELKVSSIAMKTGPQI